MNETSYAGQFLIATPIIALPPFARSVVLLLEHDDSGAIGVIINQPTDLLVADHLPDLGISLSEPAHVFLGGPVSSDTAIVLARGEDLDFLRPSTLGDIGIVDVDNTSQDFVHARVFAGYSGWDPGQLEAELEEGAWWPVLAAPDEIFAIDVADMWEKTVERAPGSIPLYATYPDDPSEN
ncbi:MAG: YqgE/AlgH family protein [Actinomycetota bacterium]